MKEYELKLIATSKDYLYEDGKGNKFIIEHNYENPMDVDDEITMNAVKVSQVVGKEVENIGMFGFITRITNKTDLMKDLNKGLNKFFEGLEQAKSRAKTKDEIEFDNLARMFNDFMKSI